MIEQINHVLESFAEEIKFDSCRIIVLLSANVRTHKRISSSSSSALALIAFPLVHFGFIPFSARENQGKQKAKKKN